MGFFDVNFDIVTWRNIPTRLRRLPEMFPWLRCLTAPVRSLYGLFMGNRKSNLYYLAHNGQVCYLQAVLNDTFDNTFRRIYISDGVIHEPVYLFLDAEDEPVFIDLDSEVGMSVIDDPDPVPLYCVSETGILGTYFIVNVPVAVSTEAGYSVARLRALVDEYRLASKSNYSIRVF